MLGLLARTTSNSPQQAEGVSWEGNCHRQQKCKCSPPAVSPADPTLHPVARGKVGGCAVNYFVVFKLCSGIAAFTKQKVQTRSYLFWHQGMTLGQLLCHCCRCTPNSIHSAQRAPAWGRVTVKSVIVVPLEGPKHCLTTPGNHASAPSKAQGASCVRRTQRGLQDLLARLMSCCL